MIDRIVQMMLSAAAFGVGCLSIGAAIYLSSDGIVTVVVFSCAALAMFSVTLLVLTDWENEHVAIETKDSPV